MFCTKCGAKNHEDAFFCEECGHQLNKAKVEGTTTSPPLSENQQQQGLDEKQAIIEKKVSMPQNKPKNLRTMGILATVSIIGAIGIRVIVSILFPSIPEEEWLSLAPNTEVVMDEDSSKEEASEQSTSNPTSSQEEATVTAGAQATDRTIVFDKAIYLPGESMIAHLSNNHNPLLYNWEWEPADEETLLRNLDTAGRLYHYSESSGKRSAPYFASWIGGTYLVTATNIQNPEIVFSGTYRVKLGSEGYWKRVAHEYPENHFSDVTEENTSQNILKERKVVTTDPYSYDFDHYVTYRSGDEVLKNFNVTWEDLPDKLYPDRIETFTVWATWDLDSKSYGFQSAYDGNFTFVGINRLQALEGSNNNTFTTEFTVPRYGKHGNAGQQIELVTGITVTPQEGWPFERAYFEIYARYEYVDED